MPAKEIVVTMSVLLAALLVMIGMAASPLAIAACAVALVLLVLGSVVRHLKTVRSLPTSSDADFLDEVGRRLERDERPFVASSRQEVATALGVPASKLTPDLQLLELGKRLEFLGSFSISFNDLHDDLDLLFRKSEMPVPNMDGLTVGQLVAEMARAKQRLATEKELAAK